MCFVYSILSDDPGRTSTGGIGAATAIALSYGHPKTLFLTGRTLSKTSPAIAQIATISPNTKTVFVSLDLADLDSVRQAAKTVLESGDAEAVHGLINNAGIMCAPFGKTRQEIESQFAAGPNARILNVVSSAYVMNDVNLDGLTWSDGKAYHPWLAYGSSKTAVILFNAWNGMWLMRIADKSGAFLRNCKPVSVEAYANLNWRAQRGFGRLLRSLL
ncbi:hypothetical protein DL95DRAFT_409709 [Leptodontidium sp. 2 PMI_412]|nr:hypothetical protein DL95DRAFT_409709 [Leptodontidium sp. 2 PMI_412]